MKRKNLLLTGTKVTVDEANQQILDNYLTNYEIHEFPKNKATYSLTDEDSISFTVKDSNTPIGNSISSIYRLCIYFHNKWRKYKLAKSTYEPEFD